LAIQIYDVLAQIETAKLTNALASYIAAAVVLVS